MGDFQFDRVGYFSNVNRMSVQYADGAKNKPADFSYDKLMDMDAMRAFLNEQNAVLTEEMNQKLGNVFESVGYDVRVFSDGLSPHLQMVTKNVLSKDMRNQCEEYLESYQKRFAKDFNKQSFTETEYGFAKFPSKNKFGISLCHDDKLISDQRLSVTGGDKDTYKEIIAFPSLKGDCNYCFKFDEDKWPAVDGSQYYTKNGTMRESTDPVMIGVKGVLEKRYPDSIDEITIYSDQCVIVTMPPVDDSAIYSIANELADYGMSVKNEQVGEELEAALATIKNAGLEIK